MVFSGVELLRAPVVREKVPDQRSPFLTFASFASFARTPIRAGEQTRAKPAKPAKVKAIKHDEIAPVVLESACALQKELDDPGTGQLSPFLTLASFASFARTPIRAGESTRAKLAKLAKDAKLKGKKHAEITPVVVESAFALQKELDDPGTGQRSPFLTFASFASFARTPIRAEE